MAPACIVYAWPPVLWQADSTPQWHFVHLGTQVLSTQRRKRCSGQTVWANSLPEGTAGLAWDWVQLPQGVVAMADPFGLISNLCWVDANGRALPTIQQALHLNEIVHALPWQTEVERALQDEELSPPMASYFLPSRSS
jgi:hypothetical protein